MSVSRCVYTCFYLLFVLRFTFRFLFLITALFKHSCRYYIEVLHQEYTGIASVDVGFYKETSPFTAQQTVDAVNEIQVINASYDVLDEIQVGQSMVLAI